MIMVGSRTFRSDHVPRDMIDAIGAGGVGLDWVGGWVGGGYPVLRRPAAMPLTVTSRARSSLSSAPVWLRYWESSST